MTYIYYVDGEKFTCTTWGDIPKYRISSPDENTPAYEDLLTGEKLWCLIGYIFHRLTGPASIDYVGNYEFYLNGEEYSFEEWIKNHPNPDLYFDAIGLNETERILWFLQN
jgi:hypothetical protein